MSTRAVVDLLTVPSGEGPVNREPEYLSEISPSHKPWDVHRGEADDVSDIYVASPFRAHHRFGTRMGFCSQVLNFARDPPTKSGQQKLKLKTAWFCRVRFCPVCQWRRSLQWQARLYQALPRLMMDFPDARFLFLTLTIRNCSVAVLRNALSDMARAWQRLTQLQIWPALGWVRALEITRSKDSSAHPHFHALLMVPPTYFQADYLRQSQWAELWQQSLRINYRPIVDVRVIRQNRKRSAIRVNAVSIPQMWAIVTEILKYSVKPSDMIRDHKWFLTLVDETRKTRAVAVGGVLKKYLRKRGKENLVTEPAEEQSAKETITLSFGWKQEVRRYRKIGTGRM